MILDVCGGFTRLPVGVKSEDRPDGSSVKTERYMNTRI